jgi:hypothetical protein
MTLEVISIVVNVFVVIALAYVGSKTSKIDKLEEALEDKAAKLIEAKFSVLAAEMNTPIAQLATIVDQIQNRLARGDESFNEQFDKAHELEIKQTMSNAATREWAMKTFVTREEFHEIADSLRKMQVSLARLETLRPQVSKN